MNSIHSFDLNLIRVFDALIEERNATRAGQRLGLTQSAVSHGLARLREILGDELFVRGPGGMHPTPRAEELARPLRAALAEIATAFAPPGFDPARAHMRFVVATSDFYIGSLFPKVLARIGREAPGVQLWLRPFNDLNLVEELDRGTLHLAVGRFGRAPARFRRELLKPVDNVWVMRAGHPAAGRPLTVETLGTYAHIDIQLSGQPTADVAGMQEQGGLERAGVTSDPAQLEVLLRKAGLTRRVGATVSLLLAVPPLVAATDMIAFLPRIVAEQYSGTHDLVLAEPPYAAPPITIEVLSHNTFGNHPAVAWLRELLQEAAGMTRQPQRSS